MKEIKNHKDFVVELHKEMPNPPGTIPTKGYGQLQFECGCGALHGVNDYEILIVATYFPVKVLFLCSSHYTKVQIKGLLKQKCLSLWTIKADLVKDIAKDLNF